MPDGERRLAAIMFTDIVGYTSLAQTNEALAMKLLEDQRNLVRLFLPKHSGREVKTMGDAFLVEFGSALEAVRCALDIQQSMHETNLHRPEDRGILLRIGIHLGDVIHDQNDVYGDAVNIASRIEPISQPEGICVSEQVYDQVANKFEFPLVSVGPRSLKNVRGTVEVYKVVMPWEEGPSRTMPSEAVESRRIAVLPFTNMSPDPSDEYFADGLTEEVISTLSKVRDFEIISRTSVMQYKKTSKPIMEVSRELDAGTILEGSVRKAGKRLRITVKMIDAARDRPLWTESYDRDFRDIFAIQGDIATRVADALKVEVLPAVKADLAKMPTSSTEAYALYLKGRHFWNKMGLDDLKKALEYFELAVHEDPGFSLGYDGQADCYLTLRDGWNVDPAMNLEKAKAMVTKALELNPALAEAHATSGNILIKESNLKGAEAEFKRAIQLKPSYADVRRWYTPLLASQLRWEEALEQIDKAVELDPLSPAVHYSQGLIFVWLRQYSKAVEPLRRAVELGLKGAHFALAYAYGKMRRFEEMRREYATVVNLLEGSPPLVRADADALIAYHEGDNRALRKILPELVARFQDTGLSAYEIAGFYFHLGENDKGFEWLERSYSNNEGPLHITYDEDFDSVRDDPRYLNLLKRLGLS